MISSTSASAHQKRSQAKRIIRNAAIASSTAAGATAQVAAFGADTALTLPIIIDMIKKLENLFQRKRDNDAALRVARIFLESGAVTSKSVLGFVPVLGNFANAAITYSLAETIGWVVYEIFNNGEDLSVITEEQIRAAAKRVKRMSDK